MTADPRFYDGRLTRTPFSTRKTSADASGNGVEVVAAAASGYSHHVTGLFVYSAIGSDTTLYLAHTAGAAGKTQIFPTIDIDDAKNVEIHVDVPLQVGDGLNLGIVAGASGNIDVQIWGYTAEVA